MSVQIDEMDQLKRDIAEAVENVFLKYTIDSAYYPIVIDMYETDDLFTMMGSERLLDTRERGVCMFCGKDSFYYSKEHDGFICPSCYRKLTKEKFDVKA